MRKLMVFIWTMLVLGAMVPSCSNSHRYDNRLMAADSLIHDHADSAMALLEALSSNDLATDGDRAYRDLLLVQARYKAYVTATSDSDINYALAYYKQHPKEKEKLTRANIYKGAVMEELGHPDSALLYFKTAETTADPDDYYNLGYSKMRIASLYKNEYSQDSAAIIRLKEAIYYFEALKDTNYLISCYGDLGAICGLTYPDSTEQYLVRAIQLAQQYKPSKQYTYISKLAGFYYFHKNDYLNAKELAMYVLRNGKEFCKESQFYTYAALAYAKLGRIDSAKHVFQMMPPPVDPIDSMGRYDVMTEIAQAEKFGINDTFTTEQSYEIATQILKSSKETELGKAEVEFNLIQESKDNVITHKKNKNLMNSLIFVFLLLLLLLWIVYRLQHSLANYRKEITSTKQELTSQLEMLKQQLNEKNDVNISQLVGYRMSALNELFQSIRVKTRDESKVKHIVPLSSLFKTMNERHEILNLKLSNSFWERIKLSVDGEFNGIATFVEKNYPQLSDSDLKLFNLLCANISPQIIKLCMNYTSAVTVSNYKNRLIKKKIGIDAKFEEFIQMYMENRLQESIKSSHKIPC